MTEEEKKAADAARKDAEDKAKADARKDEGGMMDAIMDAVKGIADGMKGLCDRVDAMEMADKARKDAAEAEEKEKADKAKKDEAGDEPTEAERTAADKAKKDAAEEEKAKEDKARKDAEAKEEEQKADARADAAISKRLADLEKAFPKPMSDKDYAAIANAQAEADSICQAFGDSAPRPLNGETLDGYERRMVNDLKSHSPRWKDADIYGLQDSVLAIAKADVYADAAAAARRPVDMKPGELREVHLTNKLTGGKIIEFVGPNTMFKQLNRAGRRARIRDPKIGAR
jgi:flagellar biosynthesis GTPase FlhF